MAFRSFVVSAGTTATKILEAQAGDLDVGLGTVGAEDFRLGGSNVTVANGLNVDNGEFRTPIRPGDELWGIVNSGTADVRVLVRSA